MKFGVPWNVRGVRADARDTARKAARRSGMSVGEWLNAAIVERAADDGVLPEDYDDEPRGRSPRADNEREFDAINARLTESVERIDRRLDGLINQFRAPPEYRPSGPEAYAPRRSPSPPMAPQWAPPPPMGWAPAAQWAPPPAQDDWSRGIDAAVAEISARQRALDTDPEAPPAPARLPYAPRDIQAPPMAWAPPPPPPDFSVLEHQLRQITEQIQSLNRPQEIEQGLVGLRRDLADIGHTLTEAMPRRAIDALENEMRRLTGILEQSRQAGAETGTIGEMARGLLEIRETLRGLTPAENLAGFQDMIAALAHKIDAMSQAGTDPAALHQLESAIDSLRGVVSHVASNETLANLADEVRGLSHKIEQIAASASDRLLGPELESQLRAFTEQLQRQGESAAFGQLQERIASLSAKLDASDARLTHLGTIERELRDLVAHLEELRSGQGGAAASKAVPAVDAIQRDLSRTRDSVEAVHETVGDVVDRLAMIESEMREAEPAPAAPASPPRVAPKLAAPVQAPEPAPARPAKAAPPVAHPRRPIDPNLPPDYPLEPGTGAPQARLVGTAAERIAASEAALNGVKPAAGQPSNFIAAARRAAQAAATPPADTPPGNEKAPAPTRGSLSQRMRRLLGGAAVILILVAGYKAAVKVMDPVGLTGIVLPLATLPITAEQTAQLEADDEEDEPAIEAPATRPAQVTPGNAASWLAATGIGEVNVTGAIPPAMAAIAPAAPAPASFELPPHPLEKMPPSAKLPAGLRNALSAGDPVAAYEAAMRNIEGRGMPVSLDDAARWMQVAAKAGLVPAQFRLGSFYEKGQGVKKNLDAARQLYVAAAERGSAKAMHNLAVLYAEGVGGKPDYAGAVGWFRKAAQHGVADSQYNLGILYARGIGVEQNLPESYKWFALAADQGDKDAAKKRDDVGTRLDQGALTTARLAVKAFIAQPQPDGATVVKLPEHGWGEPAQAVRPKKPAPASTPLKIKPT